MVSLVHFPNGLSINGYGRLQAAGSVAMTTLVAQLRHIENQQNRPKDMLVHDCCVHIKCIFHLKFPTLAAISFRLTTELDLQKPTRPYKSTQQKV